MSSQNLKVIVEEKKFGNFQTQHYGMAQGLFGVLLRLIVPQQGSTFVLLQVLESLVRTLPVRAPQTCGEDDHIHDLSDAMKGVLNLFKFLCVRQPRYKRTAVVRFDREVGVSILVGIADGISDHQMAAMGVDYLLLHLNTKGVFTFEWCLRQSVGYDEVISVLSYFQRNRPYGEESIEPNGQRVSALVAESEAITDLTQKYTAIAMLKVNDTGFLGNRDADAAHKHALHFLGGANWVVGAK